MRIIGVGADWCDKCKSAKEYLAGKHIEWVDYQSEVGKKFIAMFHEEHLPFFVIVQDDGTTRIISSMLEAKNL